MLSKIDENLYLDNAAEAKPMLIAIVTSAIYDFYLHENKEVTFEIATIYKNLKVII